MLWLKLGWRNLRRNRRRTAIELASISGSVLICIFITNFAQGAFTQMIETGVRIGSGHIGVYRGDYLSLRRMESTVPAGRLVSRITGIPGVRAVFPRLYVPCLARSSRNSKTAVFMGVDFQKERDENPALARKRFISGGIPSPLDSSGVVIGTLLAEALHVSVGSRIVMMAQGPGGEIANELFFVSGVIKTGIREFDSTTVIASRSRLGSAVGCVNDAHEISVMLSDPKKIPAVLSIINGILCEAPGVRAYPWNKAMPGLADIIWLYRMMLRIIVIILYLIVGVGTVNTLLMSVMERVREFGVIRALGMDRSGALRMVCAEALVLAAAGTVLGDLFSAFLGLYTSTAGIDVSMFIKVGGIGGTLIEPVVYTGWNMKALLTLNIGMICIALAASLYPAYHVTGVKPSEAMRKT